MFIKKLQILLFLSFINIILSEKNQTKSNNKISNNSLLFPLENDTMNIKLTNETIKNDEKENNELLLIKKNLEDKDKEIKKLKDKNIIYEKEKEDINFYKKSYEEQKLRVNEEHKLISDSLYKLAIHFISLKDDLQNRINSAKKNK